jgi:hypothetical protein
MMASPLVGGVYSEYIDITTEKKRQAGKVAMVFKKDVVGYVPNIRHCG